MGAEAVLDRSARSSWCFYSASPAPIRVASSAGRRSPQACRACARVVCLDDGALPLPGVAIHGLSRLVASPAPDGFERFPFNHPLFVPFSSGTLAPMARGSSWPIRCITWH
jgi:hypothetical protein